MRCIDHGIQVARGLRDATAKLDISEGVMKGLLVKWCGRFLDHPRLEAWIRVSWASSLAIAPEDVYVGDVVTTPVICLPPPPTILFMEPFYLFSAGGGVKGTFPIILFIRTLPWA